ncbi:MAG TPA: sulfate adenylyltransferase [Deltaproteobacteria bacterium]|nr:sulfate adenylyltransferase [Deltaproteobacteria bacterium]
MTTLSIDHDAYLEATNLSHGVFHPLEGFMAEADYRGVVKDMHTGSGVLWPLPITLDVPKGRVSEMENRDRITLSFQNEAVGELTQSGIFEVNAKADAANVFGTNNPAHPGVNRELHRSRHRIGGRVVLTKPYHSKFPQWDLTPSQTKTLFAQKGWHKIASFQTRNPPHLAHEYLQRVAMEISDGILIQPLIGWKKRGDFTPQAIMGAYEIMIRDFYPGHAVLATLRTPMRYAGPREAVFHAILRRNHGCTAFIVGRDHAGVGTFYGKYEAQELAQSLAKEIGIEILTLAGPRYCSRCECISTERTCGHGLESIIDISGTEMRRLLSLRTTPDPRLMRKEISSYLIDLSSKGRLFCE